MENTINKEFKKTYLVRYLPEKPFNLGAIVLLEVTFGLTTIKNGLLYHRFKVEKVIKSDSIVFHPKCLYPICRKEAKKLIKIYKGKKTKLFYDVAPFEESNLFEAHNEKEAIKYYIKHRHKFRWFGKKIK